MGGGHKPKRVRNSKKKKAQIATKTQESLSATLI